MIPLPPPLILGMGLNYRRHAEETKARIPEWPVVFTKFPGSVVFDGEPIRLPRRLTSDRVDYESELALVLGRECRDLDEAVAWEAVAWVTCANDVSARDWQIERSSRQWSRAKSFDTFCPLGPRLVDPRDLPNRDALSIACRVNGVELQRSNTADMIFSVPQILAFLTADTTLPAGTVILTGTPEGVGMAREPEVYLKPGDLVEVEIEGIGTLRNPVE